MTMSKDYDDDTTTAAEASRGPLRLRMGEVGGSSPLDGSWWPQSRSLTTELKDLVDHFPAERGRVVRAIFSPPDWDDSPSRVPTGRGYVRVGSDAQDDTHVMILRTSEREELCLLVVPPEMSSEQGEEAMSAALTRGYAPSPAAVLETVRERLPDQAAP